MKKRIAAVMVCLAIAAISVSGTMAYFTSDNTARNVITSGNIKIELVETEKVGDTEVPFTDKSGIMPGDTISKIVRVENTGDNPAYIRVKVDKNITLAAAQTGEINTGLITCDFNTTDWTKQGDYWYYNYPLAKGERTTPLFTVVTFDKDMGNLYQNCKATIDVIAQAVQVQNNSDSVLDAKGWSAE